MTQHFETQLKSITQLSPLYYECVFTKPEGFSYKAGQYCEIGLRDKSFYRPYSIASAPHEDHLVFHIKKSDDPTSFSQTIIKQTSGAPFSITHAMGDMVYQPKEIPMLFLTGGVGFAPFYAILKSMLHNQQTSRPFSFYWECKSEADFYHLKTLEKIIKQFDKACLTTTLTPLKTVAGSVIEDFDHLGEIDVYVAGSPDMAFKTIDLLNTIGLEQDHLYCDYIQNHKK